MAQVDTPNRSGGPTRPSARDIAERAAAARELQETQTRIETLRILAEKRFSRLNRAIVFSVIWIGILGALFLALGWYWTDLASWVIDLFGFGPEAVEKGKGK